MANGLDGNKPRTGKPAVMLEGAEVHRVKETEPILGTGGCGFQRSGEGSKFSCSQGFPQPGREAGTGEGLGASLRELTDGHVPTIHAAISGIQSPHGVWDTGRLIWQLPSLRFQAYAINWSLTRSQDLTMGTGWPLPQTVLGKLDGHIRKNSLSSGPLLHATHKH